MENDVRSPSLMEIGVLPNAPLDVAVGDICECLADASVFVEAKASEVACDIESTTAFELLEIGDADDCISQRCKIKLYDGTIGWMRAWAEDGSPAISRSSRQYMTMDALAQYEVGSTWEMAFQCRLREFEELNSFALVVVDVGCKCTIIQRGEVSLRRAKVSVETPACSEVMGGWISLVTRQGEPLLQAVGEAAEAEAYEDDWEDEPAEEDEHTSELPASEGSGNLRKTKSVFGRATVSMKSVFGKRRTVNHEPKFFVGDLCEVVLERTLREEESDKSKELRKLPVAVAFEVLEAGMQDARFLKIRTFHGATGWISSEGKKSWLSSKSSPAIKKSTRALVSPSDLDELFAVGKEYEVMLRTQLRSCEDVDGPVSLELHPGTPCKVLEHGQLDRRQVKVKSPAVEGWLTVATEKGELVLDDPTRAYVEPFLEAAADGNILMLKEILAEPDFSKPNCTSSMSHGRTAVMYAAAHGRLDALEYLLTQVKGVDANAADDSQCTALHLVALRTSADGLSALDDEVAGSACELLFQSGANLEAQDADERTALLVAAGLQDVPVCSALLQAKANVSAVNREGQTSLELAQGCPELADLCANAANVAAQSSATGSTAASTSTGALATPEKKTSSTGAKKASGKKKAKAKAGKAKAKSASKDKERE
eukprot:TRINITY_DN16483_c0_g1_i2.p1 TRINITY_DN16483_c0_g1~~TRINITY_DN16483_c0_g1_i2.p1  ORF type:complete len:657 (+),score=171.70 TRINITY_DN16483_c0_g1_i2:75-2045(+)